jgi:hypothetical protein
MPHLLALVPLILIFIFEISHLKVEAQQVLRATPSFPLHSRLHIFAPTPIPQPFLPNLTQWVENNFPELKLLPGGVVLDTLIKSPAGIHVRFAQTYKGKKIYDATLKVNLTRAYEAQSAINNLKIFSIEDSSNLEFKTNAYNAVLSFFPESFYKIKKIDSCYFIHKGELKAAYRAFLLERSTLKAIEAVMAASSGVLLSKEILSVNYCLAETTAQGFVYNPDPLTRKGKHYQIGTNFADNDDQNNPELDAARSLASLHGCKRANGVYTLNGPFVKIIDMLSPYIPPVTSSAGKFLFNRSQPGFEQVNAYYHIDTFHRYLESIGYGNLVNYPIAIDAQGTQEDNSYFTPQGSDSYIIFGTGGVDDAEDADVIIHEYGHAMTYSASPGTNRGAERKGLDEGYGDYFAASYSLSQSSFRWQQIYSWDGHNEFWEGRVVNSMRAYQPEWVRQNIYRAGMIWASALAHAMQLIDPKEADKIVAQSMYMLESHITLPDAAWLVLQAENNVTFGKNKWAYVDAFCLRNLLPLDYCQSAGLEEIPSANSVTIYPNPAAEYLALDLRGFLFQVQVKIFDNQGKCVYQDWALPALQSLEVKNLPEGLYFIVLQQGNQIHKNKFVIARQ